MRYMAVVSTISVVLTVLVCSQPPEVSANHLDGHLHDWLQQLGEQNGLQQGLISGVSVAICSSEFPSSTQTAIARWNASSALNFTAFTHVSTCPAAHVAVGTAQYALLCEPGKHACVRPSGAVVTGDPDYAIVNPTSVVFNPALFGPLTANPDGATHTNRDVTHELGHVLGHADYSGCPGGQLTLMDTDEVCPPETPQPLDRDNYFRAYYADNVSNLAGSSPAQGVVSLAWDASNVHNENNFSIQRDGVFIGNAGKNSSGFSLGGQPAGLHQYTVLSHTYAECQGFGGYCASVSVNVNVQGAPPPARPRDLHWKTSTTSSVRLEWTDNSTTETTFEVWKCGDTFPSWSINSTTTAGTGTKYERTLTIPSSSKGCYTVLAANSAGASAFAPAAQFVNTTKGNCISENPCASHSSRRIEMLVSKPTESSGTVNFIAYSRGSGTLYRVDFWDNIVGAHWYGPVNVSSGNNTGWRTNATSGTNTVVVLWCQSTSCSDMHWEALPY